MTQLTATLPRLAWRGANADIYGGAGFDFHPALPPGAIVLGGGLPGGDILPIDALDRAFHEAITAPGAGSTTLQYHSPFGVDELRQWIAQDQGAEKEDVLVTNGALHSIAFVIEALIDPGDLIVVESPTYPLALRLFRYFGAELASVPLDADGIDVDRLEELLRGGARPKALYLIPDFQNPTGVTLAAERRARILGLAEEYGFVIISDNPYVKLRFAGEPVADFPAGHPNVALVSTFSKVLGPGLRVGWLIVPAWLREPAVRFRWATDQHASHLTQRAYVRLLEDGAFFNGLVRDARAAYATRAQALSDGIKAGLGNRAHIRFPEGGLFLWVQVPGADLRQALAAARPQGLDFRVGNAFDPGPDGALYTDAARLSYSGHDEATLAEAARRFVAAVVATA